jgi:F-type H+-transporting ATPase subunit epsilon
MASTFACTLITPERAVFEREATFVAFPAVDGEMGILAHRAPLLAQLGAGELRVESPAGRERLFVAGGFAQMVDNRLTLLTEEARPVAELDRAAAVRELESALGAEIRDPEIRERAIAKARAKVRLAPR